MNGSTEYTDMDAHRECMDILLIGKTGNGKSSTGNSILGRQVFTCTGSTTSVTKEIQSEYSNVCGRIVQVVDGPGVFDTDLSQADALIQVVEEMQYAVAANPRGYHAILLILRYGVRFTNEDKQAVQLLKGIFGPDLVREFTILVLTHGDNFHSEEANIGTFEEWCFQQAGVFKDLLVECRDRVILFDNKTKDVATLNDQRCLLLTMIDSLSHGGQRYGDEHFKKAQDARDRLLAEFKFPVIREGSLMEASLIIQQFEQIQLRKRLDLKRRVERLIQDIIDQDRGTGRLNDVLNNARNISLAVDDQIENTYKAVKSQEQIREWIRQMELLKKDEERYRIQQQEEAQQGALQQIAELQRTIEENQARHGELTEQIRQTNLQVEREYHSIVNRQKENLMKIIIRAIGGMLVKALKIIFR